MHTLYCHINYNLTGTSPNAKHLPDQIPTFFRTKTLILGVWKISSSPKLAPKSPRRTVENLLTLAVNPQRIFHIPKQSEEKLSSVRKKKYSVKRTMSGCIAIIHIRCGYRYFTLQKQMVEFNVDGGSCV